MTEYETDYWRLNLADGWEWEEDEELSAESENDAEDNSDSGAVSFFHPDSAGVLSISCSEKEEGFVETTDLEDFAAELVDAGLEPKLTQVGALHGFLFEHPDEEDWWREWFLACDDLFFYITYNCPLAARGAEDDALRDILHRLEIIA